MKKLITLLIFAGLTSAAFAQYGYGDQQKNRYNGNEYQQSQNTGNMEHDYAYGEGRHFRGGDYDNYSRDRHWERHHRRHHRHRHEGRRFHREHYYERY